MSKDEKERDSRNIKLDKFSVQDYALDMFSELTIDVDLEPKVDVTLIKGCAETGGIQLKKNRVYSFGTQLQVSIFSYQGCLLRIVKGTLSTVTRNKDTIMSNLLDIHLSLERYRRAAIRAKSKMPVTICLGAENSGKNGALEILLNYSLRQPNINNRKIIYVELNTTQGFLSIPGSLGACILQNPCSVREGIYNNNISQSIIYSYGRPNPCANLGLYKLFVKKLSKIVKLRTDEYKGTEVIINMPNWEDGRIHRVTLKTCQLFQVSHAIVFDNCRAYNKLCEDLPPFVKVINEDRMFSAPIRVRRDYLEYNAEYFFGTISHPFSPYRIELTFTEMTIFNVARNADEFKSSRLGRNGHDEFKSSRVEIGLSLVDCILAGVHQVGLPKTQNDCYKNVIKTYVCIYEVNKAMKTVNIISVMPRKDLLPCYFVLTSQKLNKCHKRIKTSDMGTSSNEQ